MKVVQDVKITVTQAVEPVEKGITALNERLQQFPWTTTANKVGETNIADVGIEEVEKEKHEIDVHPPSFIEEFEEYEEKPTTS